MFEPENPQPATGRDRAISLAFFAVLSVAFGADLLSGYEPAKLSIPFMLVAWAPLLVLHECAHAVAAHAVGWRVEEIVIGYGGRIAERRFLGARVEVRALPVEGFVRCSPREIAGVRWKNAFIYFAGPGSQLALSAALLLAVGPDVLLARSREVPILALQSVALASALSGVLNLMPHSTFGPHGEMPSDGLGILQTFARPHADWAADLRRRRLLGDDDEE